MSFTPPRRFQLLVIAAAALIGLALLSPAHAQSDPVASVLKAFRVERQANGKETLSPAGQARPGTLIQYELTYSNRGKGAVRNLLATLPVPAGMEYVAGTATPKGLQASLDGTRFSPVPLMRTVTGADGKARQIRVPEQEYRFLRWPLDRLEAGARIVLVARARIVPVASGK